VTVAPLPRPIARGRCTARPGEIAKNLVDGVTKGFEKKLEITGVGYAPRCRARTCQLALATAMTSSTHSGRHHDRGPKPTEITITEPISSGWGRSPPKSAATVRGAYKGKGREVCPANSSSARKAEEVTSRSCHSRYQCRATTRENALAPFRRRSSAVSVFARRSTSMRRSSTT